MRGRGWNRGGRKQGRKRGRGEAESENCTLLQNAFRYGWQKCQRGFKGWSLGQRIDTRVSLAG